MKETSRENKRLAKNTHNKSLDKWSVQGVRTYKRRIASNTLGQKSKEKINKISKQAEWGQTIKCHSIEGKNNRPQRVPSWGKRDRKLVSSTGTNGMGVNSYRSEKKKRRTVQLNSRTGAEKQFPPTSKNIEEKRNQTKIHKAKDGDHREPKAFVVLSREARWEGKKGGGTLRGPKQPGREKKSTKKIPRVFEVNKRRRESQKKKLGLRGVGWTTNCARDQRSQSSSGKKKDKDNNL